MTATGTEARRHPRFNTIHEVLRHVEALSTGKIRAAEHATPAQIVQHLADWIHGSIDGFGRNDPERLPDENTSWIGALCDLRLARDRLQDERMTAPHPRYGYLGEVEWIHFHCRNAEQQLSYLQGM